MGIVLKFLSMVAVSLGKLAFIGTMALTSSKLALLLVGISGLKNFFNGSDGVQFHQGYHYHDDQYAYYGGDGHNAQQRMTYIIRGRQLGNQEDWAPRLGVESRRSDTEHVDRPSGNMNTAEKIKGDIHWIRSLRADSRDDVEAVTPNIPNTTNANETSIRKSKSMELTEQHTKIGVESSGRKTNYEADKIANSSDDIRQMRHWDVKNETHGISVEQLTLNPNSISHGDNGAVTPHEALYTRDGAERDSKSHATSIRYDQHFEESIEGGHERFENQSNQGKGSQNQDMFLVKRNYTEEKDGQYHDKDYSGGWRRLDQDEGEHADILVIRRKMSRM